MKAKQREGRGKTVERKKSDEISLYITPIHVHNTLRDTTTTHSYTKLSKFHPHADPFHNFHSQRKLTHFTICGNSHSHTHEHKITSTHTPIYNPHAPRAYFRAKSKREERFGFGTTAGVSGGKMVLVEALGERECFG